MTVIAGPAWRRVDPSALSRLPDKALPGPPGPYDQSNLADVLQVVTDHPSTLAMPANVRSRPARGAEAILTWIGSYPGAGWRDRWVASGADAGMDWINAVIAQTSVGPLANDRQIVQAGFRALMLIQVLRPSYDCLAQYRSTSTGTLRRYLGAAAFGVIEGAGVGLGLTGPQITNGVLVLTKVVLHTGKPVDELVAADLHEYTAWVRSRLDGKSGEGYRAAWELLQETGAVSEEETALALTSVQRKPPETAVGLVDRYRIQSPEIRHLLIRYLSERRPAMDHSSFVTLAAHLVKLFWADIEQHHPGVNSLHLPADVAEAWRHRVRFKANGQPRRTASSVMARVRAFYLDIQEWALEDPSWARWAAPSPVRPRDQAGQAKFKRATTARIHQRIRERLPKLPVLVETAEQYKAEQQELLAVAAAVDVGEKFDFHGTTYRRTQTAASLRYPDRYVVHKALIDNMATGERIDVTKTEDDAFWSWAVIETLRHTGVRLEELGEITHLALVSYRLADTGELVPMLQIVPSKSDEERVLLISPELASVLASIITRLRRDNDGQIPLVARYDPHERVNSPLLPHLFQRKAGWRTYAMGAGATRRLLSDTLQRAGVRDNAGDVLQFTPHDFRRMFATEAVAGGLPVHIAAKLLGHRSLATTQAYLAVFDEELIRAYRAFLSRRRAYRPPTEYREPTAAEWTDFQQHFELRKVELGTCSRPYGSPCIHEHACIRCPMLRIDPRQRQRLAEIAHNLAERIAEAKLNGWHGEVAGLQVSLRAAQAKLASVAKQQPPADGRASTDLGLPVFRQITTT
jgi:integrase